MWAILLRVKSRTFMTLLIFECSIIYRPCEIFRANANKICRKYFFLTKKYSNSQILKYFEGREYLLMEMINLKSNITLQGENMYFITTYFLF